MCYFQSQLVKNVSDLLTCSVQAASEPFYCARGCTDMGTFLDISQLNCVNIRVCVCV